MSEDTHTGQPQIPFKELLRNFVIEMIVYGILIAIYFYIALRFLADPLAELFNSHLAAYAFLSLGLMVVQAVVLEFVTSLLFDFLGLHRLSSKPGGH